MSIALGVALYFVIWWTVLFAVLPFGVRTQAEDNNVVPGTPESAPVRPRIMRIVAINTVVTSLIFLAVWSAIKFGLVPTELISPPD